MKALTDGEIREWFDPKYTTGIRQADSSPLICNQLKDDFLRSEDDIKWEKRKFEYVLLICYAEERIIIEQKSKWFII